MKTILYIGILLFGWQNLSAQVIPINHNMRNLKVGNVFIYEYQSTNLKTFERRTRFIIDRVMRYDTINNKVYAIFQNGVRERADSAGVYWIPLSRNQNIPFTTEYLRYPLFPPPTSNFNLLSCGETFMDPFCSPENDSINRPEVFRVTLSPDTDWTIVGLKVRNFFLNSRNLTQYATIVGPWQDVYSGSNFRSITTLCGAVIEGKYYGDSACLVASSTPLRGEEFSSFSASLAPNPAADITTIRFTLPTAQGLTVEIRDMLGREVVPPLVVDALSSGMNAIPIDVSSLPRGVYALRLRSTLGLRATTMFVKE